MALFLYTLLLMGSFPFFLVWFLWQNIFHCKYRRGFFERLGVVKKQIRSSDEPVIWIHAASVGEVLASEPILTHLQKELPSAHFVLTTNTDTGHAIASQKLPFVEIVCQALFDFPFIIGKFIKATHPSILIVMETEIWPNMISTAYHHKIPIIIANGRMSDRAFPRYRLLKWFFRLILPKVSVFAMQSERDARKIIEIGAPPDSVIVTGNVKFDRSTESLADSILPLLINRLGWHDATRIFVAGSTHAEEEEIICRAFHTVRVTINDFKMILAPRHLHRVAEVIDTLKRHKLTYVQRTTLSDRIEPPEDALNGVDVMILDVMGELTAAYAVGHIAFVGGSLQNIGGHNVLEPASLSRPVLFGPYTANFKEAVEKLLVHRGGRCVNDADALADAIIDLTRNPGTAKEMGLQGYSIVTANRGAVHRHISLILNLIAPVLTGSVLENQRFSDRSHDA